MKNFVSITDNDWSAFLYTAARDWWCEFGSKEG